MIDVNGIAHVFLSVGDFERSRAFYRELLPALGLDLVFDGEDMCYHVGGRTAVGIQRCADAHAGERFDQGRVGLHHVCFRARSRADVDRAHDLLRRMHASIVTAPSEGPWAPGYYYVLFEDPDGIRLEINYVPGQGVLADDVAFEPATDYR